jgi:succinate dehydrogenase hydrophobic anchor subunit
MRLDQRWILESPLVNYQPSEQLDSTWGRTTLALAVLAILYHNVDLGWRVAIDDVLGARTLKDIDEGRCRSDSISAQRT